MKPNHNGNFSKRLTHNAGHRLAEFAMRSCANLVYPPKNNEGINVCPDCFFAFIKFLESYPDKEPIEFEARSKGIMQTGAMAICPKKKLAPECPENYLKTLAIVKRF